MVNDTWDIDMGLAPRYENSSGLRQREETPLCTSQGQAILSRGKSIAPIAYVHGEPAPVQQKRRQSHIVNCLCIGLDSNTHLIRSYMPGGCPGTVLYNDTKLIDHVLKLGCPDGWRPWKTCLCFHTNSV